ncbi:MAG: hypothetical protein E6Q33_07365 [Neisseriales bacterium]|nr:MAG: hypothetical protein E6Q33_07365 [Neisseriales bacterium]
MERIPQRGDIIQFLCNQGDKRHMQAGVVMNDVIFPDAEIKMIPTQFLWGQYHCEVAACRVLEISNLGHLEESFNQLIRNYPYLKERIIQSSTQEVLTNEPTPEKTAVSKNPPPIVVDELPTTVVEAPLCQAALF